jgi:hypothetical protein
MDLPCTMKPKKIKSKPPPHFFNFFLPQTVMIHCALFEEEGGGTVSSLLYIQAQ